MNEPSFRDKIVALQKEWLKNPVDDQKDPDFWIIMDSISEELAYKWAHRLSQMSFRDLQQNNITIINSNADLLSLRDILSLYDYNKKNDKNIFYDGKYHKITRSQKFLLLFKVIKYWDHLEMAYYC